MSVSTVPAAARAAFEGLIDYAGLFPPAALQMAAAVEEYVTLRARPEAWMLGKFVVPAAALDALRDSISRFKPLPAVEVSVIAGSGATARTFVDVLARALEQVASLRTDALVRPVSIEIPLPSLPAARDDYAPLIAQLGALRAKHVLGALPAYVEIPQDARFENELPAVARALARAGLGAKLRCGGVSAEAFPPPQRVACFIASMCEGGVPFKCTAGLHHPVRRTDPATGFRMHGFLNVLAATALPQATRIDGIAAVLCDERPEVAFEDGAMTWGERRIDAAALGDTRARRFVAYGSCSFNEPVEDLRAIGLLA